MYVGWYVLKSRRAALLVPPDHQDPLHGLPIEGPEHMREQGALGDSRRRRGIRRLPYALRAQPCLVEQQREERAGSAAIERVDDFERGRLVGGAVDETVLDQGSRGVGPVGTGVPLGARHDVIDHGPVIPQRRASTCATVIKVAVLVTRGF